MRFCQEGFKWYLQPDVALDRGVPSLGRVLAGMEGAPDVERVASLFERQHSAYRDAVRRCVISRQR